MNATPRIVALSSTRKFFILLSLTLMLAGMSVVNAQDNANSTTTNTSNSDTTANQNSGTNRNLNSGNQNTRTPTGPTPTPTATPTPTPTPTPDAQNERKAALANSSWFLGLVCLMFTGVLGLSGYAIYRAVRYSRTTYNSPLGLPDGSLRAMLAYTLVAFLGFYILAGILTVSDFKPPDFLLGIVATVIGFYFGSRTGDERGSAPRTTGTIQGNVTDKTGAAAGSANVELSQSDGKKLTQKADANGKYKFESVAAGDYDILATLTGHSPSAAAKVKMTSGSTQTVNLILT
jgi:hypothetical protein